MKAPQPQADDLRMNEAEFERTMRRALGPATPVEPPKRNPKAKRKPAARPKKPAAH